MLSFFAARKATYIIKTKTGKCTAEKSCYAVSE